VLLCPVCVIRKNRNAFGHSLGDIFQVKLQKFELFKLSSSLCLLMFSHSLPSLEPFSAQFRSKSCFAEPKAWNHYHLNTFKPVSRSIVLPCLSVYADILIARPSPRSIWNHEDGTSWVQTSLASLSRIKCDWPFSRLENWTVAPNLASIGFCHGEL